MTTNKTRPSEALRNVAQVPAWNDMSRAQKGVYAALKTCLVTFLVTVCIVFSLYCVWVLAEVYLGPDDVQVSDCSQVPVAQGYDVC